MNDLRRLLRADGVDEVRETVDNDGGQQPGRCREGTTQRSRPPAANIATHPDRPRAESGRRTGCPSRVELGHGNAASIEANNRAAPVAITRKLRSTSIEYSHSKPRVSKVTTARYCCRCAQPGGAAPRRGSDARTVRQLGRPLRSLGRQRCQTSQREVGGIALLDGGTWTACGHRRAVPR